MTTAETNTEAPAVSPEPTTAEFWITAHDLTRILSNTLMFAGVDDTLPVLKAVQFKVTGALPEGAEPQGQTGQVKCVATDRHMLAIDFAHIDPPTADVEFLLDGVDARGLLKLLPKFGMLKVTVVTTPGPYTVSASITFDLVAGVVLTYQGVEGGYPQAESLIPTKFKAVETIGLNPSYLLRFTKVDPGNGQRKGSTTAVIRFQGAEKTALVTMGDTFTGLLMPIRLG